MDTFNSNCPNYLLAPLSIAHDQGYEDSCMALINEGCIKFFSKEGNPIDRSTLNLPDVFILMFQEGEQRSFKLAKDKVELPPLKLFVINKEDQVLYVCEPGLYRSFLRLSVDSIILGIKEVISQEKLLTPKESIGRLIWKNKLTDESFIGVISDYFLFKNTLNEYKLYYWEKRFEQDYEANRYEDDESKWVYDLVEINFNLIDTFNAHFLVLWKTWGCFGSYNRMNVVYFEKEKPNYLQINSYGYSLYDVKNKKFYLTSDISHVRWENWEDDIQLLNDSNSLIIHQKNNIDNDEQGFTIIIKYDGAEYEFELFNEEKLGSRYNAQIKLYENSLILIDNKIYNQAGEEIATKLTGYDYQKNRAHITEYAIFSRDLKNPKINSNIYYDYPRYGVIRLRDLKLIVPNNFNKIDYIVLEEPSTKHYRVEGTYEIYIKCCIECPGVPKSKDYWGLFKDDKMILPCFYKQIEILRVKNQMFIEINEFNDLKGLLYKDQVIVPCNYWEISPLGYYLKCTKEDDFIDLLYTYRTPMLMENYNSVIIPKIKLPFIKDEIISEDLLIVEKNGKFGIIAYGRQVVPCENDEIKVLNADRVRYGGYVNKSIPLTHAFWFAVRLGDKWGIYGNIGNRGAGIFIEPSYYNVDVIDWRTECNHNDFVGSRNFLLKLDGQYLIPEGKGEEINTNNNLCYRGFLDSDIIVFSDDKGDTVEFYSTRGSEIDKEIIETKEIPYLRNKNDNSNSSVIESDERFAVPKWGLIQPFSQKKYVFSFQKNMIIPNPYFPKKVEIKNIDDEEDNWEDTDQDNYDYDRDTYYALGGTDYDAFKENGGSLDDMMDGMGL